MNEDSIECTRTPKILYEGRLLELVRIDRPSSDVEIKVFLVKCRPAVEPEESK
jgi:hypothetical protein